MSKFAANGDVYMGLEWVAEPYLLHLWNKSTLI